jgi:phosphatidylglycerophosphatase C
MRLVVFDLDGTITYRDTLLPYVSGYLGRSHRSRLRMLGVIPALCGFAAGAADRGAVKSAFIRSTLRGASRAALAAWTQQFVPWVISRGSSSAALGMIKAHREAGDVLVLMSASTDLYVPEVGAALGFGQVICTGVGFDAQGRLSGELTTANRQGMEKVRCFKELQKSHPGLQSMAYGNAASDLPHLVLADVPRLVNPSARTIRKAAALGIAPYANWHAT